MCSLAQHLQANSPGCKCPAVLCVTLSGHSGLAARLVEGIMRCWLWALAPPSALRDVGASDVLRCAALGAARHRGLWVASEVLVRHTGVAAVQALPVADWLGCAAGCCLTVGGESSPLGVTSV